MCSAECHCTCLVALASYRAYKATKDVYSSAQNDLVIYNACQRCIHVATCSPVMDYTYTNTLQIYIPLHDEISPGEQKIGSGRDQEIVWKQIRNWRRQCRCDVGSITLIGRMFSDGVLQEIKVLKGPLENPEVLRGTLGPSWVKKRCFRCTNVLNMHGRCLRGFFGMQMSSALYRRVLQP